MSVVTSAPARVRAVGDPRAGRPLRAVLDALGGGAASFDEVAERTGLPVDVVAGAVEHLARLGRVSVSTLDAGCPGGGCGACPIARVGSGCDRPGRAANRFGPVLVSVTVR